MATTSRTRRAARSVVTAAVLAVGLLAVPAAAQAQRMDDTAVGTRHWVKISSNTCKVWASNGSAWVYIGTYSC